MAITTLDRRQHRLVGEAIANAVAALGAKNNFRVRYAGGTIGDTTGIIKLDIEIVDTKAGVSGKQQEWNTFCRTFGLTPEQFGSTFPFRGRQYQVIGINPGADKYCVEAKRLPDGKVFRFPRTAVLPVTVVPSRRVA